VNSASRIWRCLPGMRGVRPAAAWLPRGVGSKRPGAPAAESAGSTGLPARPKDSGTLRGSRLPAGVRPKTSRKRPAVCLGPAPTRRPVRAQSARSARRSQGDRLVFTRLDDGDARPSRETPDSSRGGRSLPARLLKPAALILVPPRPLQQGEAAEVRDGLRPNGCETGAPPRLYEGVAGRGAYLSPLVEGERLRDRSTLGRVLGTSPQRARHDGARRRSWELPAGFTVERTN
jgi:hypothetical protein